MHKTIMIVRKGFFPKSIVFAERVQAGVVRCNKGDYAGGYAQLLLFDHARLKRR